MSSSSDQDEFYDATDQSPSSSFDPGLGTRSVTLSEIEEEERRLLLLKKRAEERRRQEDEELEKRLLQLEQQKRAEAYTKAQDPDHLEHEGRRRKLEEMRQSLGTDHSFFSTSNDSSLENDSPNTSLDIPDIFALARTRPMTAPKSHTIEKMENSGDVATSRSQHMKKRSGSWGDLPKADAGLTCSASGLGSAADKGRPSHSAQSSNTDITGSEGRDRVSTSASRDRISPSASGRQSVHSVDASGRQSVHSVDASGRQSVHSVDASGISCELNREDKLSELDQNMARFQPEKEKQNKSLTLLISGSKPLSSDLTTYSLVDRILEQTQVQEDSEPDIIKSTKSRTPPATLKPPSAPPRKKRARNNMGTSTQASPSSTSELSCDLDPTPPLFIAQCPPSPDLGQRGRINSLDVKSVLEGSRYVYTQYADPEVKQGSEHQFESTSSVGSTNEALRNEPDTSGVVKKSLSAAITDGCMDSLTMQIQNWQSLGNGGREASPNQRPRSNSGRLLSDEEILELVTVRNLDTGETMSLNTAEDKLPKCVNPLALHIMRRTKEYSSDTSLHIDGVSDESDSRSEKSIASSSNNIRRKGVKIKKLFGRTVNKVKSVADHALSSNPPVEEEVSVDGKVFKIKSSSKNKGPYDFSQPNILQELSGDHTGAIWTMKFSPCGKLLATGGQDSILRIWVLQSTYDYFEDFRQKYGEVRLSPTASHDSLNMASSSDSSVFVRDPLKELNKLEDDEECSPFKKKPFCVYKGHTADLLDLSWSKNYFILSSSMDKTVRLWHISRRECLCTFQHIDFVTAIVFHPKDDRYFLSGSLDGKLRLWNIPDKKVTLWNELSGTSNLITTANFCYNGRLAVVGTYDGKCIFYTTEQLKYYTMVNVRSSRGKNSRGRKITGIESMPGEEKILITSNDSRIRLYNLRDLTLTCKYKGCTNNSSQIRASFSPTGKYVVCGSEDHFLYVWKTNHEFLKFTSARRDRNDYWEAIKVHNAVVTAAVFAPNPSFIFRMAQQQSLEKGHLGSADDDTEDREIIVSADFTGAIKVITNRPNCRSMFY